MSDEKDVGNEEQSSAPQTIRQEVIEEINLPLIKSFILTFAHVFIKYRAICDVCLSRNFRPYIGPVKYLSSSVLFLGFMASVFSGDAAAADHSKLNEVLREFVPFIFLVVIILPSSYFLNLFMGRRKISLTSVVAVDCYSIGTLVFFASLVAPFHLDEKQNVDAGITFLVVAWTVFVLFMMIRFIQMKMYIFKVGYWRLTFISLLAFIASSVAIFAIMLVIGGVLKLLGVA